MEPIIPTQNECNKYINGVEQKISSVHFSNENIIIDDSWKILFFRTGLIDEDISTIEYCTKKLFLLDKNDKNNSLLLSSSEDINNYIISKNTGYNIYPFLEGKFLINKNTNFDKLESLIHKHHVNYGEYISGFYIFPSPLRWVLYNDNDADIAFIASKESTLNKVIEFFPKEFTYQNIDEIIDYLMPNTDSYSKRRNEVKISMNKYEKKIVWDK